MVTDPLSLTLSALADPTRRAILQRLSSGEASVSELTAPLDISMPAVSRHLKVLEQAGLVVRTRHAQWRPVQLNAAPLAEVSNWVERYRRHWEQNFDGMDAYLAELQKGTRMARSNSVTAEQQALVLDIDRVFDAPRTLVWRLWRDPEHMVRWHGPEGYALLECDIDFRVGGKWRRCMSNGPGHAHWIYGAYLEIEEPSRLSFTYVNEHDGFESVVTMDFLDEGGKTRMLFRQTPFISKEERDGHGWGWNSGFDVFAGYLERFIDDDWRPKGRPRSDGVAADIIAARRRQMDSKQEERRADTPEDR